MVYIWGCVVAGTCRTHMTQEEEFFPPIVYHHFTQGLEDKIVEVRGID